MRVGEIEADYIGGVPAMVVDHAEVDVVAPIERVTAEIGMAKIRLPGIVIPPVGVPWSRTDGRRGTWSRRRL
jgi:hypothetical protein